MTTINGQPQQITAHDLWIAKVQREISAILLPRRIREGKSAFMISKIECFRQAEEVFAKVSVFETLRLRVHVDEVIKKLEALTQELKDTPRWKFVKRSRIHADIEIWKQAVSILTNTRPPEEPAQEKPKMNVSR